MDPIYIVLIVLGAIILLTLIGVILFLYATKPGTRKCGMEKYQEVKFAHRGLHDGGRAENSISAFRAAKEAGFGIELDVRLSKDGELVVFHDNTLNRVCGVDGKVIDYTADELSKMSLSGTADGIPLFSDVLKLIDGSVPLLVEIKMEPGEKGIAAKLAEIIDGYHGDYIVESFNPIALAEFAKLKPEIPRGILSMQYSKEERFRGKLLYTLILENMLLNFLYRPDFIAYEKGGAKNSILRLIRKNFGTPLFAWTVKSADEEEKAISDGFDSVIFEGYIAEK